MRTSHVRRGFGAVFMALVVAACGGGDSTGIDDDDDDCPGAPGCQNNDPDPVATTQVAVRNNLSFSPPAIRVSPGATVTWTWEGTTDEEHNVYFASSAIADSPDQRSGAFQATMPTTPGTYSYECQHHSGMTGSVLVQ